MELTGAEGRPDCSLYLPLRPLYPEGPKESRDQELPVVAHIPRVPLHAEALHVIHNVHGNRRRVAVYDPKEVHSVEDVAGCGPCNNHRFRIQLFWRGRDGEEYVESHSGPELSRMERKGC